MSNHQALINAVKYSHINNGEVIIKLNDQILTGNITDFELAMNHMSYTTFEIKGVITE